MVVVLDAAEDLTALADRLCAADPAQLADGETVQVLLRQLERLNAAATRVVSAFDAGRAWEAEGARTAAAWLAARCNQPVATARRRVQLGRALRHMPAVEAAWLAGDIGEAHVVQFASVLTPATADCFARDEALLASRPALSVTATSPVAWPTGPSWPTPTAPSGQLIDSTPPVASTSHRASVVAGCSTGGSTLSAGPWWPPH